MAKTIQDKVVEASAVLQTLGKKALRQWAIEHSMDNRSAFPKFKSALLTIGINYGSTPDDNPSTGVKEEMVSLNFLQRLAKETGGRYWEKQVDTKLLRRIYFSGGNNYHYEGKWYVDFDEDEDYTVHVWLDKGFGNKKSEQYMAKHKQSIENLIEAVIITLKKEDGNTSTDNNKRGQGISEDDQ